MKKKNSDLVGIWRCLSNIPCWLRLLWLTKQCTEDELTELMWIDDEFRAFAKKENYYRRKKLRNELPWTTDGWLKIFPEAEHLIKPASRSQRKFTKQLEIARSVDLESVIDQYVNLKRSGVYKMVGLCPFHTEKTPSFMVYKTDNHYHCFGCHEHGDAINFVRKIKKLSFKTAVRVLYEYSQ